MEPDLTQERQQAHALLDMRSAEKGVPHEKILREFGLRCDTYPGSL